MPFQRAVKTDSKLRLALSGPAGSGKTYTALLLATELAGTGRVAVLDTEHGSARKYADQFEFDVLELDVFHPDNYIAAIEEAATAGYAIIILDSISHAWNGPGGLLEVHNQVVARQRTPNSYIAWAEVTPIQMRFIEAMIRADLHIIATMRSKTEYVMDGKDVHKVGMQSVQRDGMDYEFDVHGELNAAHRLVIDKTRCPALSNAVIPNPGVALAQTLRAWLQGAPALATDDQRQRLQVAIQKLRRPPQSDDDLAALTSQQADRLLTQYRAEYKTRQAAETEAAAAASSAAPAAAASAAGIASPAASAPVASAPVAAASAPQRASIIKLLQALNRSLLSDDEFDELSMEAATALIGQLSTEYRAVRRT